MQQPTELTNDHETPFSLLSCVQRKLVTWHCGLLLI